MAGVIRTCLCTFVCLVIAAHGATVTPMEKVITLLKDLSAKVTAEGKKEAAQYDKFACFCKEQIDEKLSSILKSNKTIESLEVRKTAISAEINELKDRIDENRDAMQKRKEDIEEAAQGFAKSKKRYQSDAQDMNEAIAACRAALQAFKDSQDSMTGAKLTRAKKSASMLLESISKQPSLSTHPVVALLSNFNTQSQKEDQAPVKFQYQSNDIIATIESLLTNFNEQKRKLDIDFSMRQSDYEMYREGQQDSIEAREKDTFERNAMLDSKTEELEETKLALDEETKDRDADSAFSKELSHECKDAALLFDDRSKVRADELQVLQQATDKLLEGAVPNYSVNKELVGIQKKSVVEKAKVSVSSSTKSKSGELRGAATFVQINQVKHNRAGEEAMMKKVIDTLHGAAGRTRSTVLASVTIRVKMAEDHFVKVRKLITDLMKKLRADAESEADQKSFCDKNMKKSTSDRDEAQGALEMADAKLTTLTAKKNDLIDDIARLQSEIAATKKGELEQTELRGEDKANIEQTIALAQEGIAAVNYALNLMRDFYKQPSFLQGPRYATITDSDGKSLNDLAPENPSSRYAGSTTEGKGIIGIMEVILSDFQRTIAAAKQDNELSKSAFRRFEQKADKEVAEKNKKIETAQTELTSTEAAILAQEGELAKQKEIVESCKTTLEDMRSMCVQGEETWEERKKKREEEIEALKSALEILEDWQGTD